jgi:predicted RNA binding protein YcfA (HicA-like mRNA interferase family)
MQRHGRHLRLHILATILTVPLWYHSAIIRFMPPKVRELIKQLENAGFVNRGGKGGHRNFRHVKGINITISGKTAGDAKPYQVIETARVIILVNAQD